MFIDQGYGHKRAHTEKKVASLEKDYNLANFYFMDEFLFHYATINHLKTRKILDYLLIVHHLLSEGLLSPKDLK